MENIHIIVLAGGKGVRMKCEDPKVLTEVKGKTLIEHLLKNITPVCARPTIVVGYKGEEVIARLGADTYDYVWQKEQLGTGHAVASAKASLENKKDIKNIIVVYGDMPFFKAESITKLAAIREKEDAVIAMGTVTVPNFEKDYSMYYNFGRIIRGDEGAIVDSVELKDASEIQRAIKELNICFYCFEPEWLWENIGKLGNKNKAGEYYLTDVVRLAFEQKKKIVTTPVDPQER